MDGGGGGGDEGDCPAPNPPLLCTTGRDFGAALSGSAWRRQREGGGVERCLESAGDLWGGFGPLRRGRGLPILPTDASGAILLHFWAALRPSRRRHGAVHAAPSVDLGRRLLGAGGRMVATPLALADLAISARFPAILHINHQSTIRRVKILFFFLKKEGA